MKKIKLKSATAALQDKKLSEEQMNDLLGGLKCPYCGYDFEPEDMGLSSYKCTGISPIVGNTTINVEAYSAEEAEYGLYNEGWRDVSCGPGDDYNTAPGF